MKETLEPTIEQEDSALAQLWRDKGFMGNLPGKDTKAYQELMDDLSLFAEQFTAAESEAKLKEPEYNHLLDKLMVKLTGRSLNEKIDAAEFMKMKENIRDFALAVAEEETSKIAA